MYAKSLFARFLSLLSMAGIGLAGSCESGPFEVNELPLSYNNSNECHEFCETKWDQGHIVTTFNIWTTGKGVSVSLKAFQMLYSDGSLSAVIGNSSEDEDTTTQFSRWETEPMTTDWRNSHNQIALLELEFDAGGGFNVVERVVEHTETDSREIFQPSNVPLILGAKGRCREDVNSSSTLVLKSMAEKAEVIEVAFREVLDEWNEEKLGISHANITELFFKNSNPAGGLPKSYFLHPAKELQTTQLMVPHYHKAFRVDIPFKRGLEAPLYQKISPETPTQYQLTPMTSTNGTEINQQFVSWDIHGILIPQDAVHCILYAQHGYFVSQYTSKINVTLEDGDHFMVQQAGTYTSTGWGLPTHECYIIPISEAPEDAIEADDVEAMKAKVELVG